MRERLTKISLQAFRGQAFRDGKSNEVCAAQRKYISLMLSQCVRKSLGENWGVEIDVDKIHRCTDLRLGELAHGCSGPSADKAPPDPKQPTSRAN